jgi:4-hydroxy-2-oxoheptanedioate aldolase
MKQSVLKQKLKKGDQVIGTWCLLPSPSVVNVLAKAGLDFVLIDMEHGPTSFETAQQMILAAEAEGAESVVRVDSNNESSVLKALDIGTSGVIIPHIETVEDRIKAMSYAKYPPLGIRGFSPYPRAGSYTSRKDHISVENANTFTGIITEGLSAMNSFDAIIDDINLDLIYIGAYDLSVALGVPGDVKNVKVMKLLEECTAKIRSKGKAAGALFHTAEELKYFKSIGVQFLCYRVDANVLFDSFHSAVTGFK